MTKLKTFLTDTSMFRILCAICLFLCYVSFIQILAYVLLVPIFCWGVFLLIYNEKKKHTILKTRFGGWLVLFLFFSLVTALIHITDNFLFNFLFDLFIAIYFFIFYAVHTEKHLNFRRELYTVCRFIVYFTTVVGIIGLAFLMAGISFEIWVTKFIVYENRFTGFYANPNIQGFISVAAIFCCHMLTKKDFIAISGRERVSRIWIGSCVVVNAITLLLSDSNASLLLMIAYVVVNVIYLMFSKESKFTKKQIFVKTLASLLVGVFIISSLLFVRVMFQKGFSQVMEGARTLSIAKVEEIPDDTVPGEDDVLSATARITFSHQNKNIDSGRIRLFFQAMELYKDHPVFGIGKGNIFDYGKQKFEKGIAFSNLYGGFVAPFSTDFHNSYATILVCSGAIGFILFAIFGLKFFKHITVHVFRQEGLSQSILPCMYAFLCAYAIYAFLEKALLFDFSFMVVFFWMILGYTSCFLSKFEQDKRDLILFKKRFRRGLF